MTTRIVALISGTGSLLAALLAEIAEGKLDAQVVAVVSDRPGIAGLEKAAEYGIATQVVALERGADRQAWDRQLTEVVAAYEPDLVASIGFMKLLGTDFLSQFGGRTINSHPSLLPSFPEHMPHAMRSNTVSKLPVPPSFWSTKASTPVRSCSRARSQLRRQMTLQPCTNASR